MRAAGRVGCGYVGKADPSKPKPRNGFRCGGSVSRPCEAVAGACLTCARSGVRAPHRPCPMLRHPASQAGFLFVALIS
jgi:hypothetical protein